MQGNVVKPTNHSLRFLAYRNAQMKFADHNVNVEVLLIQRAIRISHGKK